MKGDVYSYKPERDWCREGMAIEIESGRLLDTFWDVSPHDSMVDHYLTDEERATAVKLGNVDEFDQFRRTSDHYNDAGFEGYAESDRLVITSQHGLTRHQFIRKSAKPSSEHIIAKLRADVSAALRKRDYAMHSVEMARANLIHAETGKWPWEVTS